VAGVRVMPVKLTVQKTVCLCSVLSVAGWDGADSCSVVAAVSCSGE
jgi:hypothetical protein